MGQERAAPSLYLKMEQKLSINSHRLITSRASQYVKKNISINFEPENAMFKSISKLFAVIFQTVKIPSLKILTTPPSILPHGIITFQ